MPEQTDVSDPLLADSDLNEIAVAARRLAAAGGDILLECFHSSVEVTFKGQRPNDPVTEADHAVEDLIRKEVHQQFPTHGVLGEERDNGGPPDAPIVWVIDPLDGTSNFINGIGMFACSIGVLHRGRPIAGAMWMPTNRFLRPGVYHAQDGGRLMFDDVAVDSEPSALPAGSRLSTVPAGTDGVTGPAGRRFGIARTLGSTATELAFAAEGSVQMALFEGSRIWDVAGGVALCLAAGRSVYMKPRGADASWREFTQFGNDRDGPIVAKNLREWRDSLVAGDASVLPGSANDLEREQGLTANAKRAAVKRVKRAFPKLPLPAYP